MFSKFFVFSKLCQNLNFKYYGLLYNTRFLRPSRRLSKNANELFAMSQNNANRTNNVLMSFPKTRYSFNRYMSTNKKDGDGNIDLKNPDNDQAAGKRRRNILRRLKFRRLKISRIKKECKRCKRKETEPEKVPTPPTIEDGTNKKEINVVKIESLGMPGIAQSQLPPKNLHVEFMESQNLKDFNINKDQRNNKFNTKSNVIKINLIPKPTPPPPPPPNEKPIGNILKLVVRNSLPTLNSKPSEKVNQSPDKTLPLPVVKNAENKTPSTLFNSLKDISHKVNDTKPQEIKPKSITDMAVKSQIKENLTPKPDIIAKITIGEPYDRNYSLNHTPQQNQPKSDTLAEASKSSILNERKEIPLAGTSPLSRKDHRFNMNFTASKQSTITAMHTSKQKNSSEKNITPEQIISTKGKSDNIRVLYQGRRKRNRKKKWTDKLSQKRINFKPEPITPFKNVDEANKSATKSIESTFPKSTIPTPQNLTYQREELPKVNSISNSAVHVVSETSKSFPKKEPLKVNSAEKINKHSPKEEPPKVNNIEKNNTPPKENPPKVTSTLYTARSEAPPVKNYPKDESPKITSTEKNMQNSNHTQKEEPPKENMLDYTFNPKEEPPKGKGALYPKKTGHFLNFKSKSLMSEMGEKMSKIYNSALYPTKQGELPKVAKTDKQTKVLPNVDTTFLKDSAVKRVIDSGKSDIKPKTVVYKETLPRTKYNLGPDPAEVSKIERKLAKDTEKKLENKTSGVKLATFKGPISDNKFEKATKNVMKTVNNVKTNVTPNAIPIPKVMGNTQIDVNTTKKATGPPPASPNLNQNNILFKVDNNLLKTASKPPLQNTISLSDRTATKTQPTGQSPNNATKSSTSSGSNSVLNSSSGKPKNMFGEIMPPEKLQEVQKKFEDINTSVIEAARPSIRKRNINHTASTTLKTDKLSKSRGTFKKKHDGGGQGGPTGGDGGNSYGQNNTATFKVEPTRFWRKFSLSILPILFGLTLYIVSSVGATEFLRRMHVMRNQDDPLAIKMLPTFYGTEAEIDRLGLQQDAESSDNDMEQETTDDLNEVSNEDKIEKLFNDRRLDEA